MTATIMTMTTTTKTTTTTTNATAIEHPRLSLGGCYFDCTPRARRRLARRCCCHVRWQFARRCLCRAWPSRASVTCPLLPLLRVAIASTTICPLLHSLRRPSTCLASPLPCAPAICLSLPMLCVAITSVAVCVIALAARGHCKRGDLPVLAHAAPTTRPTLPLPRAPATLSCHQLPAALLLSSPAAESFFG
jgi:hypothetical protein